MDVNNKVVVVTGASRGIGRGIARVFLREGMRVAVCARGEIDSELTDAGAFAAQVDVRDYAAVEGFLVAVADRFGPVDLWVNNAGVLAPIGMTRDTDPEAWKALIDINVVGVYHGARAYIRHLRSAGHRGCLINIGSGASRSAYAGWGPYCASKAAVDHFTRVLAEEESEVARVFCLAPGVIETGMQEYIREQSADAFPAVDKFRAMHADGVLKGVESPARAMLELAFGPRRGADEVCLDVRTM